MTDFACSERQGNMNDDRMLQSNSSICLYGQLPDGYLEHPGTLLLYVFEKCTDCLFWFEFSKR